MKKYIITSLFLLFSILIFGQKTDTITINNNQEIQNDTLKYYVETNNKNTYRGVIISQNDSIIILMTESIGTISIQKSEIKKLFPINQNKIVNNKIWLDNPQSSRYFFSPNGYGLKKGEGYYQNVWVLINSFAVGITDNISIGGGVVPLFFFGGAPTPVWFTTKISIPVKKDNIAVGAGVLGGTILMEDETTFGIAYGIATIGNKNNNASLGVGYGYTGGNWSKSPLINLNFMLRLGANGYFISENYYIMVDNSYFFILSAGGRYVINEAGIDFGLIFPMAEGIGSIIALPWLGVSITL